MTDWIWLLLAYTAGGLMGALLMALLCASGRHSREEDTHDQP
ncbi:hypothetical protein [Meiothermus ruber]|uniref:DUF3789 domain-containing protein n=1 Tax=Meiothermus ruber (strain ATCC 35948 / DSM 1279 / VKM B-1258 / 21) TaxID=504728 RepID=D3PTF6_MEIRD|nr:hypothetical protein [Meiothermus ruber]ADD28739.1 hypothetical protein Mrub_1983 [Meiothermus ruber DSM 1279]AGK05813.1 hypothetical protein K649_12635 [Meiothermus ruber DSM 1279]